VSSGGQFARSVPRPAFRRIRTFRDSWQRRRDARANEKAGARSAVLSRTMLRGLAAVGARP
jgi:hypothetical protein